MFNSFNCFTEYGPMTTMLTVAFAILTGPAAARSLDDATPSVDKTIDRGLAFLAKDALAWQTEHNCASCHHAALVVWSMREAKEHGRSVDEDVLSEMTKWIAESGDGRTSVARPEGIPKAPNTKALLFALGLGADPKPDSISRDGMKLLIETVKSDQTENGSWAAWPETRPPIFGPSDETMTALAVLSLRPAVATGDESAKTVFDKGMKWLTETKTDDDPQSIAMRLVLWRRLDRPEQEWKPLVDRIIARQNTDGGWSQSKDMASDAWATGQALYALAHAGFKPSDPAITRGQAFLVKTQREDGSWPMTSRPIKPDGEGAKNLVPITGAGASWAILGLVRSNEAERLK
jgi:hypothetical protein